MVIEAHSGAWSLTARNVFAKIAAGQALQSSTQSETASLMIAQRLSIALHRENARASMKRMAAPVDEVIYNWSGWASHTDNLD